MSVFEFIVIHFSVFEHIMIHLSIHLSYSSL